MADEYVLFYIKSDESINIANLKDAAGSYVNDATVVMTLTQNTPLHPDAEAAITYDGGAETQLKIIEHGLTTDDYIRIEGTLNYDGEYDVHAVLVWNLTSVTTAGADAILLNANADADMVGHTATIVSGTNFIVGQYEVISVVAGVSITLDRTCTTAAGSSGVVNIDKGIIVIEAAYVAETFIGDEQVYVGVRGGTNISFTPAGSLGAYSANLPYSLYKILVDNFYHLFVTATKDAYVKTWKPRFLAKWDSGAA
jgi:hypothetical protein